MTVDNEVSALQFIHFTLQEYLETYQKYFDKPHAAMADTCLSYLNSYQVKALSPNPSPHDLHLQDTPFPEHSSSYWGVYAKSDLSDSMA